MERPDRKAVITFHWDRASGVTSDEEVTLDEQAANHARVRRLAAGDDVELSSGDGHLWSGRIASLDKRALVITLGEQRQVRQPPIIHVFVPVADRDRMLWLAEKAAELQVTTWAPVLYQRSKSVSPRGEGEAFDRKLRARMIGALEQSGGAWLPEILPVHEVSQMRTAGGLPTLVLDRNGAPFGGHPGVRGGMSIAVGPEGGFEPDELTMLRDMGWTPTSLGSTTLRFETAAIAALAIARDACDRAQGR